MNEKRVVIFLIAGVTTLLVWMIYRTRRKHDYPTIPLANALPNMQTGDVVLFSPRWGSFTQLFTTYVYRSLDACEFAHVGIVYRENAKAKPLLFHCELTTKSDDVFAGTRVTGVKAVDLEERVRGYKGYVIWRPLAKPVCNRLALEYLEQTYHKGYTIPKDIWIRMLDRITGAQHYQLPKPETSGRGMFCSEWVGRFLQHCGVYKNTQTVYEGYFLPSDFTAERCGSYLEEEDAFLHIGLELTK